MNLVFNDTSPDFAEKYSKLIDLTLTMTKKLVLILEPAQNKDITRDRHRIIRELAAARKITVIDLQAFLNQRMEEDAGMLWTDIIHFSQFGHENVATFLYAFSKRHL